MGKSAIAQNAINSVLLQDEEARVIFFSFEMPELQAYERHQQIFTGRTRGEVILGYRRNIKEQFGLDQFTPRFQDRFRIFDKHGLNLKQIERKVRSFVALKRIKPVKFVVLDYLGFIEGEERDIVERMSEIARGVKLLAKSLKCVILLLSQTSRKGGDGSEEPSICDGRDTGATEDSADFELGCWRPELQKGIPPEKFMEVEGQLWFRILKARRGVQDKFCVRFERETLRILPDEREKVSVP